MQKLIEDGFYTCSTKVEDLEGEQHVNVIFHEDVCVAITRVRAREVIDFGYM